MKKHILFILIAVLIISTSFIFAGAGYSSEVVIYSDQIITDRQKLYACYSLIKQTIDEYNKISDFVLANSGKYDKQFRTYSEKAEYVLKELLAERNTLIESIIVSTYSKEEWDAIGNMTIEDRHKIFFDLLGNKTEESSKLTSAISPILTELKAINIIDLNESSFIDPTEDLTTYTEQDPGGYLSETADRVTFTDVPRNIDCYLYKDKGASHFNGDFEHLFQYKLTADTIDWLISPIMMSNYVEDILYLGSNAYDCLGSYLYETASVKYQYIWERMGSSAWSDYYSPIIASTVYYITFQRDEDIGTYGTLYGYICTGNYYGESGSDLKDTLSLALHEKEDFRYFYAINNYNSGDDGCEVSGYAELYDLQETAGPSPTSYGYIIG